MIKSINHKMPQDRESLFILNIKAIPNQKKETGHTGKSQMIIATQNHLKLFIAQVVYPNMVLMKYQKISFFS